MIAVEPGPNRHVATQEVSKSMNAMRALAVGVCAALAAVAWPAAPAVADPISFMDLLARPRPAATARIHYGNAPSQFADLWLPDGNGPHPVVAMLHGGCWRADLPGVDLMAYAADDLRRRGIAVWNIEYRRLGEAGGGYPGTFEDVAAAVDWLRKIADANKLDLKMSWRSVTRPADSSHCGRRRGRGCRKRVRCGTAIRYRSRPWSASPASTIWRRIAPLDRRPAADRA
jgi:hypothetical protein